jgi:hypothetical protein
LVAIAVHGLVDVVYTNPFLIPLAWLLLGIVAGTCRRVLVEPQSAGDMTHPARDRSPASHR